MKRIGGEEEEMAGEGVEAIIGEEEEGAGTMAEIRNMAATEILRAAVEVSLLLQM